MSCHKRSTLSAVATAAQITAVNDFVSFPTANRTGCCIHFTNGGNTVTLEAGLYLINFNADLLGTSAGETVMQLVKNGVIVPGAEGGATLSSGDVSNVAFSYILSVPPSCCCVNNSTSIQVQLLETAATINNASLTIVKLA